MDESSTQDAFGSSVEQMPTRAVELEVELVERAEEHAAALGLTLERYVGDALERRLESDPLPDEQERIDEFLAEPGRREWLDMWRQKNALQYPPTMADIDAAQRAEEHKNRYKDLKEKYNL